MAELVAAGSRRGRRCSPAPRRAPRTGCTARRPAPSRATGRRICGSRRAGGATARGRCRRRDRRGAHARRRRAPATRYTGCRPSGGGTRRSCSCRGSRARAAGAPRRMVAVRAVDRPARPLPVDVQQKLAERPAVIVRFVARAAAADVHVAPQVLEHRASGTSRRVDVGVGGLEARDRLDRPRAVLERHGAFAAVSASSCAWSGGTTSAGGGASKSGAASRGASGADGCGRRRQK